MSITPEQIEAKVNKIKGLAQYKGKSLKDLREIAEALLDKEEGYQFRGAGLVEGSDSYKYAKKLFDAYRQEAGITDLPTLENLVFIETMIEDIKQRIGDAKKKADGNPAVSVKNLVSDSDKKALFDFMKEAKALKKELGLLQERQANDGLSIWDRFKEKCKRYIQTHKGHFVWRCPKCKNAYSFWFKIDDYEATDFTMLRDTFVYNEEMFKDVLAGKLTLEDVSRYWGIPTTYYAKGMYEKVFLPEHQHLLNKVSRAVGLGNLVKEEKAFKQVIQDTIDDAPRSV